MFLFLTDEESQVAAASLRDLFRRRQRIKTGQESTVLRNQQQTLKASGTTAASRERSLLLSPAFSSTSFQLLPAKHNNGKVERLGTQVCSIQPSCTTLFQVLLKTLRPTFADPVIKYYKLQL